MKKITLLLCLTLSFALSAQTILFSEDFEGETIDATTFANWTGADQDGDGELFEVADVVGQAIEASPLVGLIADSDSWESGNPNSPMTPNNYLISNNTIDLTGASDAELMFTIGTYQSNGTFLEDRLAVYISTSNDPAVIEGETPVYDSTVGAATPADDGGANSAVNVIVDISAFEGQSVYIAFRHFDTFDHNSVLIDNIQVTTNALSTDEFSVNDVKHFFNYDTKVLTLNSQIALKDVVLYNVLGQEAYRSFVNANVSTQDLSGLQSGVYIAKINSTDNKSKTIKLVIK